MCGRVDGPPKGSGLFCLPCVLSVSPEGVGLRPGQASAFGSLETSSQALHLLLPWWLAPALLQPPFGCPACWGTQLQIPWPQQGNTAHWHSGPLGSRGQSSLSLLLLGAWSLPLPWPLPLLTLLLPKQGEEWGRGVSKLQGPDWATWGLVGDSRCSMVSRVWGLMAPCPGVLAMVFEAAKPQIQDFWDSFTVWLETGPLLGKGGKRQGRGDLR